nr:u6 snrna-associated sm-like protein lsm1 [Quercus suber]
MENLNLQDAPSAHPQSMGSLPSLGPAGQPQPPVPQLPPQMFTTAAQLLDLTDKKLLVSLRDGRKLIGVLRSWDQFGNIVMQDTVERLFVQNLYADIERGLFLDLDKDDYIPPPYQAATVEQVFALKKAEDNARKVVEKRRQKKLAKYGFEGEGGGEDVSPTSATNSDQCSAEVD